ncbi:hypothetical protein CIG75_08840 [Tumebacillus algifaecis]|uniref:Sporulation protein n=1 Tax=Tumebacillus algifaecis TaxID=1214604 RepID=A0A223D138_9BACL|nr:YhcN/YlaJ family sporulation lipoprotein [Tumebacillus algifaecis]ASS75074.1 hypothetical protein CIG75_08840 [Tumebacillus algifaecis]
METLARNATYLLLVTALAATVVGCNRLADPTPLPARETQDTRADKGMQSYGGYRSPTEDRMISTDHSASAMNAHSRKPFSARGMAYELEALESIREAAVIITGTKAYVGIQAADGHLPPELPQTIVSKIRQMHTLVDQVHLTEDAQAFDVLKGYSQALEQGQPLSRYESQFRNVVQSGSWMTGS